MIVREQEDAFIMIDQHHHASISSQLYESIKEEFTIKQDHTRNSLRTAIDLHDVGWKPFDSSPMWNDEKNIPYDFITLPNTIKSVLYKNGVDIVAQENNYAALLCSHHYVRFLQKDSNKYSKQFIQSEKQRQMNIINTFNSFHNNSFSAHYELLQFFDNLSLFICLHEMEPSNEDIHFFFKNGIKLPELYGGGIIQLNWINNRITLDTPIFAEPVSINLRQKAVTKTEINEVGIINAWENTPYETIQLTVV